MQIKNQIKNVVLLLIVISLTFFLVNTYNKKRQESPSKSTETATNIFKECSGNNQEECYKKSLIRVAKNNSLTYSTEVLDELQVLEPLVRSCHSLGHSIASSVVENSPNKWLDLIKVIDPKKCSGGFFHGIIEGYSSTNNGQELSAKELGKLCIGLDNFQSKSCAHILGHINLVNTQGNIDKAIEICNQNEDIELKKQCYIGVFMENVTKENLVDHGIEAKREAWNENTIIETEKLCRKYKGDVAFACWGQIGHVYAAVNNDNAKVVRSLCQRANKSDWIENCYLLAVQKMSTTLTQQKDVNNICNPVSNPLEKKSCISHAISAMLVTSEQYFDRAKIFCNNQDEIYKTECSKQVEYGISQKK